jgi:hypothetical protein
MVFSRILALILIFIPALSFSETVRLKNGHVVEGKILEKTDRYIKIDLDGTTLTYYTEEIDGIVKPAVSPPQTISLEINYPVELDNKTKQEIYDLRKSYVSQYGAVLLKKQYSPYELLANPNLLKSQYRYTPSDAVFGQIADNKPWWGTLGLTYYGIGQKSIEGPSEESRFLINPFLLVGLDDGQAYIVGDNAAEARGIYPRPTGLAWNTDRSFAQVTYDVSTFWSQLKQYNYPDPERHKFTLIAYNARDFGFNYLYVVPDSSSNIAGAARAPVSIRQLIHCGGSCGYPGGCNNMSPAQQELEIKVSGLPARVYLKLWKQEPSAVTQVADMIFVIDMT